MLCKCFEQLMVKRRKGLKELIPDVEEDYLDVVAPVGEVLRKKLES